MRNGLLTSRCMIHIQCFPIQKLTETRNVKLEVSDIEQTTKRPRPLASKRPTSTFLSLFCCFLMHEVRDRNGSGRQGRSAKTATAAAVIENALPRIGKPLPTAAEEAKGRKEETIRPSGEGERRGRLRRSFSEICTALPAELPRSIGSDSQ